MFSNVPVPSVGASIGIERVFAILEKKFHDDPLIEVRENPSECIIATIPSKNMDMTAEKMKLCDILWEAGFKCDFNYKLNWNLGKQLTYAND
jgi:histidyl-tRNA synthetase